MPKVATPALRQCTPSPYVVLVCPIARKYRAQVFEVKDILQLVPLALDFRLGLLCLCDFAAAHLPVRDCALELLTLFGFVPAPALVYFDAKLGFTRLVAEGASCLWVAVIVIVTIRFEKVRNTLRRDVLPRFPRVMFGSITLPFD